LQEQKVKLHGQMGELQEQIGVLVEKHQLEMMGLEKRLKELVEKHQLEMKEFEKQMKELEREREQVQNHEKKLDAQRVKNTIDTIINELLGIIKTFIQYYIFVLL
jgi:hypothetical protein